MSTLPRWIEYGAFILALIAGSINAIGLLGFEHQAVSHVSGTATLLGLTLFQNDFANSLHLLGILAAFFLGASISGFLLHGSSVKLTRHYDTALMLEAVLIFIAFVLLTKGSYYGHFAASAACGLQNALATTYSGAIIRTTHVTGIFTDLGIMLGSMLRGEEFDKRKSILFLLIITGFVLGGGIGAILFYHYVFQALLAPALVCLVLAFSYHFYQKAQAIKNGKR